MSKILRKKGSKAYKKDAILSLMEIDITPVRYYRVKMTERFEKQFLKIIPLTLQKRAWGRIRKLCENPYIGKPLGYPFIRELKIEKFRIYFMIYEDEVTILLVDVSDKKEQQKIIDIINQDREFLLKFVKNLKEDEYS